MEVIVSLIVIAVIAILAAVVIPTFSGIVRRANESVALQEARNEYTAYLGDRTDMNDIGDLLIVVEGEYAFKVVAGQIEVEALDYDSIGETEYDTALDVTAGEYAYNKTSDETLVDGKTYYTSSGIAIATPNVADIENYYERLIAPFDADLGSTDVAIYAAK